MQKTTFWAVLPALFLMLSASFFSACSHDIIPAAPDENAYPAPPQAAASNINIPISIDLFELGKTMNAKVPNELYSDLKGADIGYGSKIALRIVRNGNIHLTSKNNQITTRIPIKIVDGMLSTPLLKKAFDATMYIKMNTTIGVDKAWNFSSTTASDFDWGQEPTLDVAGISIPLGKVVNAQVKAQLAKVAPMIDAQMKEIVALRPTMESVWAGLNEPRLVTDSPAPVYMIIKPTDFSMSQFESKTEKNLSFNIGINTFVNTVVGAKPEKQNLGKLPDLQIKPATANTFKMTIPTIVRYEDVRRTIQQQVLGQKYPVKDNISIEITGFDFIGRGDKIAMVIDFIAHGKKAKGKFYLVGKPLIDVATQTLYFEDLDFDIKSKNVLLGSANFLLHKPLLNKIKAQATYPLTEQLAAAKATIQQTLNDYPISENVFLKGKLNNLILDNIYLGKDYMSVFINADGTLQGGFRHK
jgi:Domain of unknown function (DUF4403)